MRAYALAFGLRWFQSRNPDVDWHHSRHWALQATEVVDVVAVDRVDYLESSGNVP